MSVSASEIGETRLSPAAQCCAATVNTVVVSTPEGSDLLPSSPIPHPQSRQLASALAREGSIRFRPPSISILAVMAIWKRLTASYAGQFDPTHRFETSWILPPGVLFGIRALLSLYAFVTLFTIFGWNGTHGKSGDSERSFSYFTHLTYWGLAFYQAFGAAHTGSYWLTGTPFLARWPKWLQIAHCMLYSTVVIYPWIVTGMSLKSCTRYTRRRNEVLQDGQHLFSFSC